MYKKEAISEYMVLVLSEFARKMRISVPEAYEYLEKYKGINFLEDTISLALHISRMSAMQKMLR